MTALEHFEVAGDLGVYHPRGRITLEQGVEMVASAIAHAREMRLCKLLVITSDLAGFTQPGLGDRFFLAEKWARASGGELPMAFVARPEFIDPKKFGVTVARNRGADADVFASEEEARAWLGPAP